MIFKRFIFFAIIVFLTVLTIGCSTPVIDVPVVTPEITPEPIQTPQPTPDPTPEPTPEPVQLPNPDNNWVELFATIHKEMTRDDFNELFGVEGAIVAAGSRTWIHEDGTEVLATFDGEWLNSAFLTAHPMLFYNPDTKFDVERIMEFENSEYRWVSDYRHPDYLSAISNYEGEDIFFDDIVEMCGGVDGISFMWFNPDTFADGIGDGFIGFMWVNNEYVLTAVFRGKDMSLQSFDFYPIASYPLYDSTGNLLIN